MSEEASSERSSSRIRDLRSLFENKTSEPSSSPGRGRSPADLAAADEPRPRSKIRASFIAVDSPNGNPYHTMASAPDFSKIPNSDAKTVIDATPSLNREPASSRRTSFSESANSDALQALKATVAQEGERRKSQAVAETVPETAVETPLAEVGKQLGSLKPARSVSPKKGPSPLQQVQSSASPAKQDKQAENPDKPVTGAEEEPVDMKPANPTSGGRALSPSAEDLRKPASKTSTKSSTAKPAPKPTTTTASKVSRPPPSTKSPQPTTASTRTVISPPKPVTKKASRTSLAASAKTAPGDKAAPKPASAATKARPREPTKPAEVPSRLTAPTAASRARVEDPAAAAAPKPTAATTRPKPSSSARPSLGRPESRDSQTGTKKSSAPVDGSFLERMTRPTAAFANRTAKEAEAKASAVKQKLPSRPKSNGQAKKARSSAGTSVTATSAEPADETIIDEPSVVHEGSKVGDSTERAQVAAADNRPGSPTVDHTSTPATNGDHKDGALEGTPAAIGAGDSIR
ncbi:hypothetical protein BST61_g9062 [Cercospora zeina]